MENRGNYKRFRKKNIETNDDCKNFIKGQELIYRDPKWVHKYIIVEFVEYACCDGYCIVLHVTNENEVLGKLVECDRLWKNE